MARRYNGKVPEGESHAQEISYVVRKIIVKVGELLWGARIFRATPTKHKNLDHLLSIMATRLSVHP
jgi:hypothetical protein